MREQDARHPNSIALSDQRRQVREELTPFMKSCALAVLKAHPEQTVAGIMETYALRYIYALEARKRKAEQEQKFEEVEELEWREVATLEAIAFLEEVLTRQP